MFSVIVDSRKDTYDSEKRYPQHAEFQRSSNMTNDMRSPSQSGSNSDSTTYFAVGLEQWQDLVTEQLEPQRHAQYDVPGFFGGFGDIGFPSYGTDVSRNEWRSSFYDRSEALSHDRWDVANMGWPSYVLEPDRGGDPKLRSPESSPSHATNGIKRAAYKTTRSLEGPVGLGIPYSLVCDLQVDVHNHMPSSNKV